jgi:hypothetical protein
MTRRSWLVALFALAAAPGLLLTAMRKPEDKLPWRTVRVAGRDALAQWERLRAAGSGYPIVVGGRDEVERLAEMLTFDDRTPAQILDAAAAYRFPQDLVESEARAEAAYTARIAGHPEQKPVVHILDADGNSRLQTAEERDADERAAAAGPPRGEWPDEARPNEPLFLARDIMSRGWRDEVFIVVLPITDPTEAPAHLKYGAWNACPAPEVHVAALRCWRDAFGFEPVSMGPDVLEGRVARRPADRDAAIALAREQAIYCPDVIDQGAESLSNLGAILMAGDWWFFWWD